MLILQFKRANKHQTMYQKLKFSSDYLLWKTSCNCFMKEKKNIKIKVVSGKVCVETKCLCYALTGTSKTRKCGIVEVLL